MATGDYAESYFFSSYLAPAVFHILAYFFPPAEWLYGCNLPSGSAAYLSPLIFLTRTRSPSCSTELLALLSWFLLLLSTFLCIFCYDFICILNILFPFFHVFLMISIAFLRGQAKPRSSQQVILVTFQIGDRMERSLWLHIECCYMHKWV